MSGPTYDPNQPTPPKSNNSWIWITLVVILVLIVGCAGICGGCSWFLGKSVTEGVHALTQTAELLTLQTAAMPAIGSSAEVTSKIGNINSIDTPTLVGTYSLEQQNVTCKFAIRGERETATVTVTGTRDSGSLRPTDIHVKFGDGSTVNVPPGEFVPELNFDIETGGDMPEGGADASGSN